MATLRIEVLLPGSPTLAERRRMYVFAGKVGTAPTAGNIGATTPRTGPYHLDLNNPRVPNAIAVTSYSTVVFDSEQLYENVELVDQLDRAIVAGKIRIDDITAAGVYLDRADLLAFAIAP